MDAEGKVNRTALIVGLVSLGLGLIIGLVVLGWWLFPVQWANFSPAEMGPSDQEEWLRMAIDSMVAHYDIVAAQTRYEYLGEDGSAILATIQANPAPQSEKSVQAFSAIVQATPPAAAAPPTSDLRPFMILLLALAVLALIGWLIYRLIRRQPEPTETLPPAEFPPEEGQPEPDLDIEAVVFAEAGAEGLNEPVAEEIPQTEGLEEGAPPEEIAGAPAEFGGMADLGAKMAAAGLIAAVTEPGESSEAAQEAPAEIPPEAVASGLAEPGEPVMASEAPRMPTDLAYVEGIGPVYAQKLKEIGVQTPEQLLHWGATPRGRQAIAERSGISHKLLLTWINHIDLYRIRGVGSEYAELLEAAGVDTVVELATRNPAHLYQAMVAVNEEKKLVRKLPVQSQVEDWVQQAKGLPRVVSY